MNNKSGVATMSDLNIYKFIQTNFHQKKTEKEVSEFLLRLGYHHKDVEDAIIHVKKELANTSDNDSRRSSLLEYPLFLSVDWVNWLITSVRRGCSIEDLQQRLKDERNLTDAQVAAAINYAVAIEHSSIAASSNQHSTHVASNSVQVESTEYVYEDHKINNKSNFVEVGGKKIKIAMRLDKPRIILFDDVLTEEECNHIINESKSRLKKSKVVDHKTGGETYDEHRKSRGTYFVRGFDPIIDAIDQRVSDLIRTPVENSEPFQILNYQIGGEFKPHNDYFEESAGNYRRQLMNGGQRIATVILYLNDVEEGGETSFPKLGLTIQPKKGSAVYFEYCNSLNQLDPLTFHAGCPVLNGEKWIMTKWVRQNEYN